MGEDYYFIIFSVVCGDSQLQTCLCYSQHLSIYLNPALHSSAQTLLCVRVLKNETAPQTLRTHRTVAGWLQAGSGLFELEPAAVQTWAAGGSPCSVVSDDWECV